MDIFALVNSSLRILNWMLFSQMRFGYLNHLTHRFQRFVLVMIIFMTILIEVHIAATITINIHVVVYIIIISRSKYDYLFLKLLLYFLLKFSFGITLNIWGRPPSSLYFSFTRSPKSLLSYYCYFYKIIFFYIKRVSFIIMFVRFYFYIIIFLFIINDVLFLKL